MAQISPSFSGKHSLRLSVIENDGISLLNGAKLSL